MIKFKYSELKIVVKIGLGIIIVGVIMFCVAASMFSYRGDTNPMLNNIGMFSMISWLPTIGLGIVIVILGTILTAINKMKTK